MRKTQFVNNEYYHIFNRGVDKREIFSDHDDLSRFFQSMCEFNTIDESIGSIFENSFRGMALGGSTAKLGMSSWKEYLRNNKDSFCEKEVIFGQFNSAEEYKKFAEDSLKSIREKKEMEKLLLE